jgi:hypothetical protein
MIDNVNGLPKIMIIKIILNKIKQKEIKMNRTVILTYILWKIHDKIVIIYFNLNQMKVFKKNIFYIMQNYMHCILGA